MLKLHCPDSSNRSDEGLLASLTPSSIVSAQFIYFEHQIFFFPFGHKSLSSCFSGKTDPTLADTHLPSKQRLLLDRTIKR